jgi:PAS domain S-box-containing protein
MRVLIATHEVDVLTQAREQIGADHPSWLLEFRQDASSALTAARREQFDVIVWDLALDGHQGASVTSDLREAAPDSATIVLVAPGGEVAGAEALLQGAEYYVARHAGWTRELSLLAAHAASRPGQSGGWRLSAAAAEAGRARALMDSSNEALLFAAPSGVILAISGIAQELIGHEMDRLVGRSFAELLVAPGIHRQVVDFFSAGEGAAALAQPQGGVLEVRRPAPETVELLTFLRHNDGHYLLCEVSFRAVRDAAGALDSLLTSIRLPVAEEPEAAVQEQVLGTRVLEVAAVPLGLIDPAGNVTHVNDALARLLACDPAGLLGRPFRSVLAAPEQWDLLLGAVAETGQAQRMESELARYGGRRRTIAATVAPLGPDAGDALLVSVDDLTRLRALSDANEEVAQQLDRLASAVSMISQAHAPRELGDAILTGLRTIVSFDAAIVTFELPENGRTPHAHSLGLTEGLRAALLEAIAKECEACPDPAAMEVAVIDDLAGHCAEHGLTVLGQLLEEEGLRSACMAPMAVDGTVVGMLYFASKLPAEYSAHEARTLAVYAAQAAGLLAKAALYQQLQRDSAFAQDLLQVSLSVNAGEELPAIIRHIAEAAAAIVGGRFSWVEILNSEGREFETTCSHVADEEIGRTIYLQVHDLAWSAVQSRQIAEADVEVSAAPGGSVPGPRRLVAIPMTSENQAIGVLIAGRDRRGELSSPETNALQLLAAQGGLAIRNAQSFESAQRRSSRMEAMAAQAREEEERARMLFEAAAVVAETTDLDGILAQIALSAATQIGFERVRVYLADHEKQMLRGAAEARRDGSSLSISDKQFSLRAGSSLIADAALSSMPYAILPSQDEDSAGQYESLFVPLRVQKSLVGIVAADNSRLMEPISHQQTRLLRSLATMASVAVERARVEELRTRFLSSISHELRAPLSSIQAYNELVLEEEAGTINEDQRRYLTRVDIACNRLKRMIEDLLSWSRLQAGEISIDKRATDLRQTITNVVESLQLQASRRQVQIALDVERDLPILYTDTSRVEQILTNLVDNAVKFNNPQGTVRVSARLYQGKVAIAVADTGPGIPKEMHEAIFEEFNRGPENLSKAAEGVGLGLAIASRLAKYLGGSITLDSEPEHGSIFFLWLPVEAPPDAEDEDAVTAED